MTNERKGIMKKVFDREPPSWQNQKLVLARKLVEQQEKMIDQNSSIIMLLIDIRNTLMKKEGEKK